MWVEWYGMDMAQQKIIYIIDRWSALEMKLALLNTLIGTIVLQLRHAHCGLLR